LVIARLKLLLLALHVKFFKLSFLVGVKVYNIKAGPPTTTTVTEVLMKVALITINQPNRPTIKGHSNLIFVFNAESPTNIAVQNETEEGIMQRCSNSQL
jgi:hypothetical protein